MGANKTKLLSLDLALALIVIALFQLAPVTVNSRQANANRMNIIQLGSDLGSVSDVGTFRIPLRPDLPLYLYANGGN